MKPRFTTRAVLVFVTLVALVLMNLRDRQQHRAELAAVKRELQVAQDGLATHGLSGLFEPFESEEARVIVIDLFGEGQAAIRDTSVVARRILIETAEPTAVFTVDHNGQRTKVSETENRSGPNSTCSITVFAHVPGIRAADSNPYLEFGLQPAGGSSSGQSLGATLNQGDELDDHFRFDLKTGVYARGEALDFYAIGGGAAGNLRPVKLFIAPAKPPIAANSVK